MPCVSSFTSCANFFYSLQSFLKCVLFPPKLTGYSFGTPQGDQFVPQGMPPPPTTPGAGPLGFAPATTPTQDMSKATPAQPDFSYSQYGE